MIRRRLVLIAVGFLIAGASSPGNEASWHHFQAPDGSFSVDFPATEPMTMKDAPRSTRQRFTSFLPEQRGQFMVEVWNDPKYTTDTAAEKLHDYPNPRAAGIDGKVVESKDVKAGRYPGREVLIEGTAGPRAKPIRVKQRSRAYIADGRLYVLTVDATAGRPIPREADHFFESFAIP